MRRYEAKRILRHMRRAFLNPPSETDNDTYTDDQIVEALDMAIGSLDDREKDTTFDPLERSTL